MALVLLHHVVGDLTVGKPDLDEFSDSKTVAEAVRAIANSPEGAIMVWGGVSEGKERPDRFLGLLNSLDLVGFLARAGEEERERAMGTPVGEVVKLEPGLLKEVDPGTRLIDALEMMKQGVRRLLVRKSVGWRGVSKRFSILYNGKWLKNVDASSSSGAISIERPSSSAVPSNKYCCLSREDVARFLIGCLGALAPIPLTSISTLGAINANYCHMEASSPAMEAIHTIPHDPCAIAVLETNLNGSHKIIGEISAFKLWKCDYLAASWAMANLSAGQFVTGGDDNGTVPISLPTIPIRLGEDTGTGGSLRPGKFSSRNIGFSGNQMNHMSVGRLRSMYRGRSSPLTCKPTSSLAAVMAQMLSHRATHVWVTDGELEDDILVGVVSYTDIINAVTKDPSSVISQTF